MEQQLSTPTFNFYVQAGEEFDLNEFVSGITAGTGTVDVNLKDITLLADPATAETFGPAPGEDPEEVELGGELGPRFRAVILIEGVDTGDGRFIEQGAVDLETGRGNGIPLMFLNKTTEGHREAVFVGNFTQIFREGDEIIGEGHFDDLDSNPDAAEAARLVGENKMNGISADLASTEFEFDFDEEGFIERIRVTHTELGAATIVTIPAFKDAHIDLVESLTASADIPSQVRQLYPENVLELLADPGLTEPTAMSYDPETGRVFGHAFGWKTCHTSRQDTCVLAPRSKTDYKHFLIGEHASTPIGVITMDTGHAPASYDGRSAMEHYDNTGAVAAYVNMGEDEHGAWFSGYLEPGLSDMQVRRLLACGVSGDWRWDDSVRNLELVSVLAVPTPGFQVPRAYQNAEGRQLSLVAAGIVEGTCLPCEEAINAREELDADGLERILARFGDSEIDDAVDRFLEESAADGYDFDSFDGIYLANKLKRILREG